MQHHVRSLKILRDLDLMEELNELKTIIISEAGIYVACRFEEAVRESVLREITPLD